MRTKNLAILTVASLVACGLTVRAAITIVYTPGGNRTPSSICPAIDGSSKLEPANVVAVPPPQAGQGVLNTLATGSIPFPGWTFNPGASLNGTLTINYYFSHFWGTHNSGASIRAVYTPGLGDPPRLRWLQSIDTTAPKNGYQSPYIDQDPAATNVTVPFYYEDTKFQSFADGHFVDFSHRPHPPTSTAKWQGTFYIASWDGNTPGVVTVHDGFLWGWIGGCAGDGVTNMSLTLTRMPSAVVLEWPTNSPGTNLSPWRLQSITNLSLSTWDDRTNQVEETNGVFQATLQTGERREFFRLTLDTFGVNPVPVPAYLAESPDSNTVAQSHAAVLSCRADGDDPITYQWFFEGLPISDATNSMLAFPHVQFTNQGSYFVVVSNAFGGDQSDTASLQVVPDNIPPQLVSASAPTHTQVLVHFSEEVNPSMAQNTANYHLQGPGGPVNLSGVIPSGDPTTFILLPNPPLQPSAGHSLSATNIADLATPPNVLPPGSSVTFMTGP